MLLFLFAYLLGGLTFLPLVALAILGHAWLTLPPAPKVRISDGGDEQVRKEEISPGDPLSAGYFAVCREFTPGGTNAKPIERPASMGAAPAEPTVVQSMYRSIFEARKRADNVFYVVLRHGHLMLFDDEEQIEVRHVIALAQHDLDVYDGEDHEIPEAELFIKRNAIRLRRRGGGRPFYLFSENCSEKEDFYFSLAREMGAPTSVFTVPDMLALVQRLFASEEQLNTRWLNGLVGRVFLAVHHTPEFEQIIRERLMKKIARVQTPAFLTNLQIGKIDTGGAAPLLSNAKLRNLGVDGECVAEADLKYSGAARVQVSATARIDLGARIKPREVDLVLSVTLKRLDGHVLFKVKAPPSNRIWLAFQTMPKMEVEVEPIVSSRQLTYGVITRQIENRIKEVFMETLVIPAWDDLPFWDTEGMKWRGGVFAADSQISDEAAASAPSTEAPSPPTTPSKTAEPDPSPAKTTEKVADKEKADEPPSPTTTRASSFKSSPTMKSIKSFKSSVKDDISSPLFGTTSNASSTSVASTVNSLTAAFRGWKASAATTAKASDGSAPSE